MNCIVYIDRKTGKYAVEKVYGAEAIRLLYGHTLSSRLFGAPLAYFSARFPLFSALYGYFQKTRCSRKKIAPFITTYEVDASEFADPVESFDSFNDFFIRKLKPEARPIAPGDDTAIIPADGRYLFYQDISKADGFIVKGEKFELVDLLGDPKLAAQFEKGTMIIARLCPSDYHRFHFPCNCVPGIPRLINGFLYSVNPMALKQNVAIFTQNRRVLTELETDNFGKVLYMEVGATNVGTIHETFTPGVPVKKGEEKGYFSFGGSALILLFQEGKLQLDSDLTGHPHMEIRCLLGQSMGKATAPKTGTSH